MPRVDIWNRAHTRASVKESKGYPPQKNFGSQLLPLRNGTLWQNIPPLLVKFKPKIQRVPPLAWKAKKILPPEYLVQITPPSESGACPRMLSTVQLGLKVIIRTYFTHKRKPTGSLSVFRHQGSPQYMNLKLRTQLIQYRGTTVSGKSCYRS